MHINGRIHHHGQPRFWNTMVSLTAHFLKLLCSGDIREEEIRTQLTSCWASTLFNRMCETRNPTGLLAWFFTTRQRSCRKVTFLVVFCLSTGGLMWPLTMMHSTSLYSPHPQIGSEIWWLLKHYGRCKWAVRILLRCFLVSLYFHFLTTVEEGERETIQLPLCRAPTLFHKTYKVSDIGLFVRLQYIFLGILVLINSVNSF